MKDTSKSPEQAKKYELTPEGLRQRLEDLGVDYLPYTRASNMHKHTASLFLETTKGEHIWISKSIEGAQPQGNFFQDLNMQVYPGSSADFGAEQVDFNFNQFGDGVLRKRVVSGKENGVEEIPEGASSEGILHLANLTLHHAQEQDANMRLEEQFGVNNTPATPEEVAEAMSYLDGASVLDPNNHYSPVAVI